MSEYLTVREAAEVIGVSINTLRKWDKEGKLLPTTKTKSGHRRYLLDDLHDYISDSFSSFQHSNEYDLESAIRKYATSLLIIEESLHKGDLKAFPSLWREATAIFRSYSIEQNMPVFPDTLDLQISYMKTPLNQWGYPDLSSHFENEYFFDQEPVLYEDGITEFCHQLAIPRHDQEDPRRYIETEPFLNAKNMLEEGEYVQLRSFPIHFPVLTQKSWLSSKKRIPEGFLNTVLTMYEPIPEECIYDGSVYLCPYCGWTLKEKRGAWSCHTERCRDFTYFLGKKWVPKDVTYTPGMQRVNRGVLKYIVMPGIPEQRVFEGLRSYDAREVSLYPNQDETDILVEWYTGEKWAIDAKDWYSHYDLMKHLQQNNPFSKLTTGVDRKIILVPKHYPETYVRSVQNFLYQHVDFEIVHEKRLFESAKVVQAYQKESGVSSNAQNV